MYGYIYKVTNKETGKTYIGKHKGDKIDNSYFGSGKEITKDVDELGKDKFEREIVCTADDKETLDKLEKENIELEFINNKGNIYNKAAGGDGGNVFKYADSKTKQEFSEKMTIINRERCQSQEFKDATSKRMKELFSDEAERKAHSERIRAAWSDEQLRAEQSERLREFYKTHTKDCSFNFKKTRLTVNGEAREFESQKEALAYLKKEWDIELCRPQVKRIKKLTAEGSFYKPFHHNRYAGLNSIQLETIEQ